MPELHWWSSSSGRIEFQLPMECVTDCSHSGPCDDDVFNWTFKLEKHLPFDCSLMVRELLEYGCWTKHELEALTRFELQEKLVWIAANDISEEIYVN